MNKQGGLIAVVVLIIVVTAISIWLRQKEFSNQFAPMGHVPPSEHVASNGTDSTPEAAKIESITGSPVAKESTPADPEFQKWLSSEAKQLDQVNPDGEAKQRELKKAVSKMTPTQSRQLLQTARNPRSPAAEKILSTFLLVESGARGHEQLAELIASPLADSGPHAPHSEEEMKGVRDKSLRIMGIDGLFAQAQHDPRARETLARAIPGIDDAFIRKYAEDKLRQLH